MALIRMQREPILLIVDPMDRRGTMLFCLGRF
ncbi:hypothetical protein M527_00485 [Sphingobium indicum IP26]|nr:hypothetical protein M527_00485 [Sphingobium indicum IP26]EQB02206.1 hypothetical protein L286_14490 [Sphingobium sp. HDIP04]